MATGPSVPILYKGAGPGTYWHLNDARASGFTVANMVGTPNAVLRHITSYSFPSPYLSFSTSFAAARSYALNGPNGPASPSQPGYVYEADFSILSGAAALLDPVLALAQAANGAFAHSHDGAGALIAEVASGSTPYSQCHHSGGGLHTPSASQYLKALIFATRDAEVLASANVLAAVIVRRHSVW